MAWRRHVLQERAAGRLQERRKREESLRAAAEAKRREQETFEVGGWVGATCKHDSWFWSEHCSSAYVVEKLRLLGGCLCFTTMQPDDVALSSSQAVQRDFGVDAGEIRRVLGLWQVCLGSLA